MTVQQIIGLRDQLHDNLGNPLSGGSIDVFAAGTLTRVTTYSDADLVRENPNPVPISGSGRATIWVNRAVDIVVRDSNDVAVTTELELNPSNITLGFNSGLIPNGGFEIDTTGNNAPDGWVRDLNLPGASNGLETGAGNVFAGTRSFRTQSIGFGGGELVTANAFDVNDSDNLLVRFVLRSTVAAVRNIVRVEWYDVTDTSISNTDVYDSTTNPATFTEQVLLAAPPSGARLARIRIIGGTTGGLISGITYWDNFRVEYPDPTTGQFDNLLLSGNTLSSTNTDGNIIVDPNGAGAIQLQAPVTLSSTLTMTSLASLGRTIVASTAAADLIDTNVALLVGTAGGQHIEMDDRRIQSKGGVTAKAALDVNPFGGPVRVGALGDTESVFLRGQDTVIDGAVPLAFIVRNFNDGDPGENQPQNVFMQLQASGGGVRGQWGFNNSSEMQIRSFAHAGRISIVGEGIGGAVQTFIDGIADGAIRQYFGGSIVTETQSPSAAGQITGQTINHRVHGQLDVGVARYGSVFIAADFTIGADHASSIQRVSGTRTITFPNDTNAPVGSYGYIINVDGALNQTLTQGTGATLLTSGVSSVSAAIVGATGNRTLTPGGAVLWLKLTQNTYQVIGIGVQ